MMIFLTALLLQATPTTQKTAEENKAVAEISENTRTVMVIDPKNRVADYMEAFNALKQEKSTAKVYFSLADGTKISNVIDMKAMPNNTLVLFRYTTPQGVQFQVVEIENIVGIMLQ